MTKKSTFLFCTFVWSWLFLVSIPVGQAADGLVDEDFIMNLGTGFTGGVDPYVSSVLVQGDGKILVGGQFSQVNNLPANNIARLNSNGSVDMDFSAKVGGYVHSMVLQEDGKILVGGGFFLTRLNSDGTVDGGFSVKLINNNTGTGSVVYSVVEQVDGKILVGGAFTSVNGLPVTGLVRLMRDGSVDADFFRNLYDTPLDGVVVSVAVQGDGKILVGGVTVNKFPNQELVRLNSDGTLDTGFWTGNYVNAIAVQEDGRIIVGGGMIDNCLLRLNENGIVDSEFSINLGTGFYDPGYTEVDTVVVQEDGKILVGGIFTSVNTTISNYLVRLDVDGSVDTRFSMNLGTGFSGNVMSIAVQGDGRILVGGAFTSVNSTNSNNLSRLY